MKTKLTVLLLMMICMVASIDAKKKKNEGEASIKFTEKTYDFGNIRENGGMVSHEFEFVNRGDGNLMIIDAKAECGCTRPSFPQEPIGPGKKGKVKVTYNPKGRPSSFNKDVTIRTNGRPGKTVLKIKGNVLP